ncbi:armadillo-type protein [Mycena polygramma]|nr:armadillo-type protein [Mycena polygramma]
MLSDPDEDIVLSARETINALGQYANVRMAVSTPETVEKMFTLVRDGDSDVRKSAVVTITALAEHAVRTAPGILPVILSFWGDPRSNVRGFAVETIIALSRHGQISCSLPPYDLYEMSSNQMMSRSKPEDDVRASICTLETIQVLVSLFGDEDGDVRRSAVKAVTAVAEHIKGLVKIFEVQ